MKGTRIKEMKYKGYLIKPSVTGFRVYRKDYFVAEYASVQIAKARIDRVAEKKKALLGEKREPSGSPPAGGEDSQLTMF